ncbi:sn-glycerol-3-phosphate ABC transporter ATP-binding protein UgpC [Helcococcus kunzii]|uniref:ABC transporter ATP-binding protein n=1 Tax=Helcococcus kunzii TaxID=40091 RepID=UPI001C9772CC|nr:sn-glycerol-3-phosphate ABC transporter ATP-binding protein UgpC [Helcococcus kunzii]QZO76022.1 sn-glycerol-3-phosphate ABC transporter ATP-binding protein UgpC [Helcococcus kunzii]
MAKLTFKNINKIYSGNVHAVKDLNLEIKDKEFVVFVGPSGCGKSTTLRMIAGLEDITSGELYIGDQLVNDVQPKYRDIAMVFQNYALYPHLNIYENIALGLRIRKLKKEVIDEKVRNAAKILGIEDLLKRKPRTLSGGQKQRVALARAIVREPEVFLMDEPLSNLDAKLRTQTRSEIIKLHNNLNTTFIYVTHDQTEAMTMADRIVIMDNGIMQQVDTPKNIYEKPNNAFVANFIGNPSMNVIPGLVKRENDKVFVQMENDKVYLDKAKSDFLINNNYIDKEILFGIRPEYLSYNEKISDECLTCKVYLVEVLGTEKYIHCHYNNKEIIVKTDENDLPDMNDIIKVWVKTDEIILFDIETEKRLEIRDLDLQMKLKSPP